MFSILLAIFTFVELNCENLFDTQHDSLKNDYEYCEGGARHWTSKRYWHKLNNIGRELVSTGGVDKDWQAPDLIALVEVENDSVVFDLTHKSLLRTAGYEYLITHSLDQRGVDVALLYQPFSFSPDTAYSLRIIPDKGQRPTRDILYVHGRLFGTSVDSIGDTRLHVFVVHAPSRAGGEKQSETYRLKVANRLCESIDSVFKVDPSANIVVMGDFNDYADNKSVCMLSEHKLVNVSANATGVNGALGTYRYKGDWGSLDHIFFSLPLIGSTQLEYCRIHDLPFLIEEEPKYGGVRPLRTFRGYKYNYNGYSDHLPLVVRFRW